MSSSLVSSQLLRVIVQIGEQNLGVGSLLWVGLRDFAQLQPSLNAEVPHPQVLHP